MTAPEDQNGLREALARAEAERDAARKLGDEWYAAWEWSNLSAIRQGVKLAAAEAEITRLKEGMEAAVGALEKIAVSDPVCSVCNYPDEACVRPNQACGMRSLDCPNAAREALAALSRKDRPHV